MEQHKGKIKDAVRVYQTKHKRRHPQRKESWLDGEIECCTPTASLQVVASRYAQEYMIHAWVMSGMISDGEKEEEELISMGELSQGRLHVWLTALLLISLLP
jgi:hypothetical protein